MSRRACLYIYDRKKNKLYILVVEIHLIMLNKTSFYIVIHYWVNLIEESKQKHLVVKYYLNQKSNLIEVEKETKKAVKRFGWGSGMRQLCIYIYIRRILETSRQCCIHIDRWMTKCIICPDSVTSHLNNSNSTTYSPEYWDRVQVTKPLHAMIHMRIEENTASFWLQISIVNRNINLWCLILLNYFIYYLSWVWSSNFNSVSSYIELKNWALQLHKLN